MNIVKATASYEKALEKQIKLIPDDLKKKHKSMAADSFSFLRATFYRWAQVLPAVAQELLQAPKVLAVGDLHIENFGTWRDIEGRLVWGVNDFDEAYVLPYTNDLVRLVTSVRLAISTGQCKVDSKEAAKAILEGYGVALVQGGKPFVLAENNVWLREMTTGILRDPVTYWAKLESAAVVKTVPVAARQAMEQMMPAKGLPYRVVRRVAGLGSLGRERYLALADFHGSLVAREAKPLVASAVGWALGVKSSSLASQEILDTAVRCPDPYVRLKGRWTVRRLSPYCSRIELNSLAKGSDERQLLFAMGWETANIHLGTKKAAAAILKDLKKRPAGWLGRAATDMEKAMLADWKEWRERK